MYTNKVDLKPPHTLIVPSKLKGYLEDTFKEDNVKVKEVIFTYHRKDVAKIRNKLAKVERALDYCRKNPKSVKLYKLYLCCGTHPETAIEYYKRRGLHFKSIFFPTNQFKYEYEFSGVYLPLKTSLASFFIDLFLLFKNNLIG